MDPAAAVPMLTGDLAAIDRVVTSYYDAFVRDSSEAADHYATPALIVLRDEVRLLSTRQDVEMFLGNGLRGLTELGYAGTRMSSTRIKILTETAGLYGCVANRLRSNGTELERTAFTYLLHKGTAGWKIHLLIATDLDKLISPD